MKIADGQRVEWHMPSLQWLICCDCGLTHLALVERGPRNHVRLRFYRDRALTRRQRRRRRQLGHA